MKKFLNCFLLFIISMCCVMFFGCDNRYGSLTMSVSFAYNDAEHKVTKLENGNTRVTSTSGTFDIKRDGSYVFYIDGEKKTSAKLNIVFSGAPKDFKYNVTFAPTNPIVSVDSKYNFIENGIQYTLNANSFGKTELKMESFEGKRHASIFIEVVDIVSEINFKVNNLAMQNKGNSRIDLSGLIDYGTNSLSQIDYSFGFMEDDAFQRYSNDALFKQGFTYDPRTEILSLSKKTELNNLIIKATYENPLGEDRVAFTSLKIVKDITDFQVYAGDKLEDAIEDNLIHINKSEIENPDLSNNMIKNFVVNMSGLNYMDVILKVSTGGEKVVFSMPKDNLSPFKDLTPAPLHADKPIVYYTEEGMITEDISKASYAYGFYRLIASENKTTNRLDYPFGRYGVEFNCTYADYTVYEGYPIKQYIATKCVTNIKKFSLNNKVISSFAYNSENFLELYNQNPDKYLSSCEKINIYTDTNASLHGIPVTVDVADPISIASQDSKFGVRFFNYNMQEDIADPSKKLQIYSPNYGIYGQEILIKTFEKGKTFYFKPNQGTAINEEFYVLIYAIEPKESELGQNACLLNIKVVQGVTGITDFDFTSSYYDKDEEGNEILLDGNKVIVTDTKNIKFDNNSGFAENDINIIKNNLTAEIALKYHPTNAVLDGLTVVSKDNTVITISKSDTQANKFIITPQSAGSTTIEITAINLTKKYTININVYEPIDKFDLKLRQQTVKDGVGEISFKGDSVKSVRVACEKQFNLIVDTRPLFTKRFFIDYYLYKADDLDNPLGHYSSKEADSSPIIEDYGNFIIDCKDNTFSYINNLGVNNKYVLDVIITNYNGTIFRKTLNIAGYVPVNRLEVVSSTHRIYDPNYIYYKDKITNIEDLDIVDGEVNDKTIFGLNVSLNKFESKPSKSFEDYGKFIMYVNGVKDSEYTLKNGVLYASTYAGSVIKLVDSNLQHGYYWFGVTKDYNVSLGNISVSAQVEDYGNVPFSTATILVEKPNLIEALESDKNQLINFREGMYPETNMSFRFYKEEVYNKNILFKTFHKVSSQGKDFFALENELNRAYDITTTKTGISTFDLQIKLKPNFYGKSVLLAIPEDKIINKRDFDLFNSYEYQKVKVTAEQFNSYLYYYLDGSVFKQATQFSETQTYYIRSVDLTNILKIWRDCFSIDIISSDGTTVEYYISSMQELKDTCANENFCDKKNYVLTRDLEFIGKEDWKTLGHYYKYPVNSENFEPNKFFVKKENNYELVGTYDSNIRDYYLFGFNGTISGRYTSVSGGVDIQYGIYGLRVERKIENTLNNGDYNAGLFASLGPDANIHDLIIGYDFYQPIINSNLIFGGLAGTNYGKISNVDVKFDNVIIKTGYSLDFGGIVGVNYGTILKTRDSLDGVKGEINVNIMSSPSLDPEADSKRHVNVGGMIGVNYNKLEKTFVEEVNSDFLFDDIGFDSSLVIIINDTPGIPNTSAGGAIGTNYGFISGFAIQGKIAATNFNNVGGLIGKALYSAQFNGKDVDAPAEEPNLYSISKCFSIANVSGEENVGGLIGLASGSKQKVDNRTTSNIQITQVSAENYASDFSKERNFVFGTESVGGLIGNMERVDIDYSYVVSYYDCVNVEKGMEQNKQSFDIVGSDFVGGFIGKAKLSTVNNCASYANVKAQNGSSFIGTSVGLEEKVSNVFAVGCMYIKDTFGINIPFQNKTYSICRNLTQSSEKDQNVQYFLNGSSSNLDAIKNYNFGEQWGKDENANSGIPFLKDKSKLKPLFMIVTSLSLPIIVKNNGGDFSTYIKNNDYSLVLFFGDDVYNKYLRTEVELLNTFAFSYLFAKSDATGQNKTSRFNISSSNTQVIKIGKNGTISIVGTGTAKIIISSKLNARFRQEIEVVVVNGLTAVNLYKNETLTTELKNEEHLNLLKGRNYNLYLDTDYIRTTESGKTYDFKSFENVGFRFYVSKEDRDAFLKNINYKKNEDGSFELDQDGLLVPNEIMYTLNDIIQIGVNYWKYDSTSSQYYADVYSLHDVIQAKMAVDATLNLQYIPFIKPFITEIEPLLLEHFGKQSFALDIKNGAKDLIFEKNIDTNIEMNQLQSFVVNVTIYTDYEQDTIVSDFLEKYENSNLKANVETTKKINPVTGKLESITQVWTFYYGNKMHQIKETEEYDITFWALSNSSIENRKSLHISVVGQDKIDDMFLKIYAEEDKFLYSESEGNVLYNAKMGLISLEVYPYFANYSKIRISSHSNYNKSLSIFQLSYNLSGTGDRFTFYDDSQLTFDENGNMIIAKSSGQDTYLVNTNGVYSYSKSYFFGIMIASAVPDETQFSFLAEVLDKKGSVIISKNIVFRNMSKSTLSFSFAENLKGQDNSKSKYYLPINTNNELFVKTNTSNKSIEWTVEGVDCILSVKDTKILTPKMDSQGKYFMQTLDYNVGDFKTSLIGKTIRLTGKLLDVKVTEAYSIDIILTLFTVTNIKTSGVKDGVLEFNDYVSNVMDVEVEAYYDKSVLDDTSWYKDFLKQVKEDPEKTELDNYLQEMGYKLEDNFTGYFKQLAEAISKTNYDKSSTIKKSGVWWFLSDTGSSVVLNEGERYDNGTFGVENHNDKISIYGYEVGRKSQLKFFAKLSYKCVSEGLGITIDGIPNVKNYAYLSEDYYPNFEFKETFDLTFVTNLDLVDFIPVSNTKEFMEMKEGRHYRLVNDIELVDYKIMDAKFKSFDGNNYNIFISSFGEPKDSTEDVSLGLFKNIPENSILFNTSVYYTSDVIRNNGRLYSSNNTLNGIFKKANSVTFAGLALSNKGTITNCKVTGNLNISISYDATSQGPHPVTKTNMAGFTLDNEKSGFITNSRVVDFNLTCYGTVGGFVLNNNGKIVSSFFDNSSINNLSSSTVGGFVHTNLGEIRECFSQGIKSNSSNKSEIENGDIRHTGNGILSDGGEIAGFVYLNQSKIFDSYSNLCLFSSNSMAGFVYEDNSASEISRCYSISYKHPLQNSTTAFPFAGPIASSFNPKVVVRGKLNNCYYLMGNEEDWNNTKFYVAESSTSDANTPADKKAEGLSIAEFETHSRFVNYNLSLTSKEGMYRSRVEGELKYSYVDGYTWVIKDGKPVIVSTLVKTVSQQDYQGKKKIYSGTKNIYNINSYTGRNVIGVPDPVDSTIIHYYFNDGTNNFIPEKRIYTKTETIINISDTVAEKTINFVMPKTLQHEKINITLVYRIENTVETLVSKNAEYGSEVKRVVDVVRKGESNLVQKDDNFRANDTLEILLNNHNELEKVDYLTLKSAIYYYSTEEKAVSYELGSRTNPELIYDYNSFVSKLQQADKKEKFYRFVRDIDLNYQLVPTVHTTFQGVIQGNHMTIQNLSLSYYDNVIKGEDNLNPTSFGLFAEIISKPQQNNDTVISNLSLDVEQVVSNAHMFVGALAGRVEGSNINSDKKVFINNIEVKSQGNKEAFVQGINAVGGLVGYATGLTAIKDIYSEVGIYASQNASNGEGGNANTMLYVPEERATLNNETSSMKTISYAGGVVGIFDSLAVTSEATQQNYNASNIRVFAKSTYLGNIVGAAFGFIGENTIVNYTNVEVAYNPNSFLKSTAYTGGLVGENRGFIVSSSIKYKDSLDDVSFVGSSLYTENDFFYSEVDAKTIAIGGIVGLNNGGRISNSSSSVNVRNKWAIVAGGAVGRMLEGTLDNVVSSGSVKAKTVIGGLIGTLNNETIFIKDGGYKKSAFYHFNENTHNMEMLSNKEDIPDVLIQECVAQTNWLNADYSEFHNISNTTSQNKKGAISGFIGTITYKSELSQNGEDSLDGKSERNIAQQYIDKNIRFQRQSYYSNKIVSNDGKFDILRPAHFTFYYDGIDKKEPNPMVLTGLADDNVSRVQKVFPYETREMAYNNPDILLSYSISKETNPNYKTGSPKNPYMTSIYTITNATKEILNNPGFYTLVDEIKWQESFAVRNFAWYIERFGKIYYLLNDEFIQIHNEQEFNDIYVTSGSLEKPEMTSIYFVDNKQITNFKVRKSYQADKNDLIFYNPDSISSRINNIKFKSLDLLKTQTHLSVNGVDIPLDFTNSVTSTEGDNVKIPLNDDYTYTFCDGSKLIKIEIMLTVGEGFVEVKNVILDFEYSGIHEGKANEFGESTVLIKDNRESSSSIMTQYTLFTSPKKLVYKGFKNGYWYFSPNFLTREINYIEKLPQNLELAEIYVWDKFIQNPNEPVREIFTPEDFATFAYQVNKGLYNGHEVVLKNDIDLSGKYWVPIGTPTHPFTGKFNGMDFKIKYASVNSNSFPELQKEIPEYGGVFGYVQGATISNVKVVSGEIRAKVAGGLCAYAKHTTFLEVTNSNNIIALDVAGGIVGKAEDATIISSCSNYSNIEVIANYTNDGNYYMGGIVGEMIGGTLGASTQTSSDDNVQAACSNYGNLNTYNMLNKYSLDENEKITVRIYAGGLAGRLQGVETNGENLNKGSVTISSNAHKIYAGGIIGYLVDGDSTKVHKHFSNTGKIDVLFKNTFTFEDGANFTPEYFEDKSIDARCNVGGLIGSMNVSLFLSNNSGKVNIKAESTSNADLGIGGLVGRLEMRDKAQLSIKRSYNIENISVDTQSSRTHLELGSIVGLIDMANTSTMELQETIIADCYNMGILNASGKGFVIMGGIVGAPKFYVKLGAQENEGIKQRLIIQNCMNLGEVAIYNSSSYDSYQVGAIVGTDNQLVKKNIYASAGQKNKNLNNFYLRGCAHVDAELASAYSSKESSTFKPVEDNPGFAAARISSTLKDKEGNYSVETGSNQPREYFWDFEDVWEQKYDTWYPTLRNNISSSMWQQKQELLPTYQENGIIAIRTPEELSNLAYQVNAGLINTQGKTFVLSKFIDLSNRFWTPIGTQSNPFEGTFKGNGYVVKNLTIDGKLVKNTSYGGLFGYIDNAEISDLCVESPYIINVDTAGGIIANSNNSKVSKVYTEIGYSKTSVVQGEYIAGGLIGKLTNLSGKNAVRQDAGLYICYNNVPVSAKVVVGIDETLNETSSIGGLVGYVQDSYIANAYNGEDAKIYVVSQNTDKNYLNAGNMVIGDIDEESKIINVFNTSSYLKVFSNTVDPQEIICKPVIYTIKVEKLIANVVEDKDKGVPKFSSMVNSREGKVEDIWIADYSLNDSGKDGTPTLRGLGREWKNADCETLVNYPVLNNNIEQTATNVLADVKVLNESKTSGIKTMVNFAYKNKQDLNIKNIYLISSENELVWVSNNVNNGNLQTAGCEFILLRDMDLSGGYWTPIGLSESFAFKGVFNFNGHVIKGLTIDTITLDYVGLFGYTKNATIMNGYLENGYIKVSRSSYDSKAYVGGLVGYAENTSILNVSISSVISAVADAGVYIGGAVGCARDSIGAQLSNVRVFNRQDSYVELGKYKENVVEVYSYVDGVFAETGTIVSDCIDIAGFSDSGIVYAGGIVGYLTGSSNDGKVVYLLDGCYNESNIAAVSTSTSRNVYAGGILGYGAYEASINNCSSTGYVKTYSTKFDVVGGIVGYSNQGSIENCLFNGYIESRQEESREGTQNIWSYLGGIVGMMEYGRISHCVVGELGRTIINKANMDICIGGIIGFAKYRKLQDDGPSIFIKSEKDTEEGNGFYQPIGYSNVEIDKDVLNKKYLYKFAQILETINNFDLSLWQYAGNKVTLSSTGFYLVNTSSYAVQYVDDKGMLISISKPTEFNSLQGVELKFVDDVTNYDIALTIITRDKLSKVASSEYYLSPQQLTNENFTLESLLQGKAVEDAIMCFIDLVPKQI